MREVKAVRWTTIGLIAIGSSITACNAPVDDEPQAAANTASGTATTEDELETAARLPYGVPIPEGTVLRMRPAPHDTLKHGDAIPNQIPEGNLAGGPDLPKEIALRQHSSETFAFPPPGTGDRGFFINGNAGTGIYVGEDAQTNLVIPASATADQTLYTPTHQAPGGACVETVTVHHRLRGASTTSHAHGFWDWCRASPGWGLYESMTSAWKSAYVRSYSMWGEPAEEMYFTEVYKTSGNCWVGQLYNFNTGRWETKLTSCGTTKTGFGTTGWTMWESWYLQGCPALPRIKASGIQVRKSTGWTSLAPADTTQLGPYAGSCHASGAYSFFVFHANDAWEARTP
jgi:hypothetical protein